MSDGFGLDHLPYGVFVAEGSAPRVGVRYHDTVVDVATVRPELDQPTLNTFMALGADAWAETRAQIIELVESEALPTFRLDAVSLLLPFAVGDYVDFYASLDHATNVGRIFRPDQEPLLPNWRHLPVGYHGRSGSVVVSGTPVVRPCGQRKSPTEDSPTYGPSRRLDIEAELGFVVGVGSELGSRIPVGELSQHVFGVVGLNDWSARDIQAWEYVPLGPFLGKSFATSVSAWVTPLAALEAARVELPEAGTCTASLSGLDRLDRRTRGAGHRRRGGAQRRGGEPTAVPHDVLVPGPDARPPHRERRQHPHG